MTENELKKLIAQGETLTVEFKRARGGVPADFWPSYSAFANTEGGVIVLGVRETDGKREVEDLADPKNYIFSLVDIGERSGMGLSSLYGVWERRKYADPAIAQEYEPDRTKIVVEFERNHGWVAEKVAEKLNQTDQAILDAVAANPEVSQLAIAEKLKMTRQYIGRRMDELQISKVIRRVGPDKGGHWEVL